MGRPKISEITFWQRVDRRAPDECWEWRGCRTKGNYGRASWYGHNGKRMRGAHRVAFLITHGVDPGPLQVCHKCDNPPCCNPNHLFLGTQEENHADKARKGRSPKGSRNWMSNISERHVLEIRQLRKDGLTNQQIARRFACSPSTISHICTGRTWKHVK